MNYFARLTSPVGEITLGSDGSTLMGLWISGQKYHSLGLDPGAKARELPVFKLVASWLERYFAGERPEPGELPLTLTGSEFRRKVWSLLLEIPSGSVTTYGELARRLGTGARAVGSAVGHNPISIIIPCHRVLGSDGSLTGYAAGLPVKMKLLQVEGIALNRGQKSWMLN